MNSDSLFRQRVIDVVKQIPLGATLSYQKVAQLAGSPRAYRAVGTILKGNYDPAVPCHRVICSDGSLGGYNGGLEKKKQLLIKEGASFKLY